jgi:hypothetical protein
MTVNPAANDDLVQRPEHGEHSVLRLHHHQGLAMVTAALCPSLPATAGS